MRHVRRSIFIALALFLAASCAWATVSTTTNKTIFTGNGSTKVFTWAFPVIAAGDVQVVTVDGGVETVVSSGITVAVNTAKTGGTVTFATAPASGLTIVIRRAVAGTQSLNLTPSQRLNVESLENAYDRAVMLHNDQQEALDRTPKLASDSSTTGLVFPEPEDGYYVGWNGLTLANLQPTTTSVAASSFVQGLMTKTTASDFMQNGLGMTADWYTIVRTYTTDDLMHSLGITDYSASILGQTTQTGFLSQIGGTVLGRAIFRATSSGTVRSLLGISEGTPASVCSRGYISGMQLAYASTTGITVTAGLARDSTDAKAIALGSNTLKLISATWAVGSGEGGLDTATSLKASTWYHVAAIWNDTTADAIIYTATAGPTTPAGYTWWRRVGSFYVGAGSTIEAFQQSGDTFYWQIPHLDYNAAPGVTTATSLSLSVPTGFVVKAIVRANTNTNGTYGLLSPLVVDDYAPSQTASPGANFASVGYGSSELQVLTNTSRQVRQRMNSSSAVLRVVTVGWVDRRGQDD
ncbi:MAG: hypothetical protein C4555_05080 [Dehalococcoidia bacterium]|nr:MAG: hypothetical protein C4555_05080 [Dehalococcoidia bacterium]